MQKPKKVKFIHRWPPDYKIYPANGLWGGVTARGDLLVHFFVEHVVVPKEQIQMVKDDGTLAPPEREVGKEPEVARDMQVGIMMNREQAVSTANWILDKIKKYEETVKKESEK